MSKKDPVILITNDDGVQSPGLKKIHSLISRYSKNVIIVAPSKNCSGSGHSITLANPIRINKISNNFYSCTGTPTDCILLSIQEVLKGKKPDLIISGINIGANLGDDATYSGTVSAAMEGALLGIKSLALSVAVKNTIKEVNWLTIDKYIDVFIKGILHNKINKGCFLNVNFPDCNLKKIRGIKVVKQTRRKPGGKFIERFDSKGLKYFWHTTKRSGKITYGNDVWAINNNYITVTPLDIDLTSNVSFTFIKKYFDGYA